jgi:outer membrane protein OmpA-like peptidoglycan-associated protein
MKIFRLINLLAIVLTIGFIYTSNGQLIKTVVAVTGNVVNQATREAESVQIIVLDDTGKKINSAKSNASEGGYYYVTGLYPGNTYYFQVNDKNFLKEKIEIKIPNTDKYFEISRDFLVKSNTPDTKFKLSVTPFENNKSRLRFGASILLDEISSTLKSNPDVSFTILSYPDNNKDSKHNKELTAKRSESLIDYFSINGIDPNKLNARGSESTDPKIPPPTEKTAKGKRYIGPVYIIINK